MATRARLQRRLEARKKDAENTNSTIHHCSSEELMLAKECADLGITVSELYAAENSDISLVEEMWKRKPEAFAPFKPFFPKNWSLNRIVVAFSISPRFTEEWRRVVAINGLENYYLLNQWDFVHYHAFHSTVSKSNAHRQWLTLETPNISIANGILMVIFGHLCFRDCLGLINLVCRRWHFVARYVWQRMEAAQIGPTNVPFWRLLNPSTFIYRMSGLTSVTLCGIYISVSSVPKMLTKITAPPVDTLRIYYVTFETSAISLADANGKICDFIRSCRSLKELCLVDITVCLVDKERRHRELQRRGLDLWYFEFAHPKTNNPLKVDNIQLSAEMLQRFTGNFEIFCKQMFESKVKAVLLCGSGMSSYAAGLSSANFVHGFTRLMPHLREISLCNLSFSKGTKLETVWLDSLAQKIRRNSSLELFCLTNAEISEEAIYNLQRCEKLQVLILLRCTIISKYPDLPLMAGWHPNSNLPAALITDDVTVSRWVRPAYFRLVRIDGFLQFSEDKFVHLRNRWWTIRALLKSAEVHLPDFLFSSLYLDPEEIIGDSFWLQ